MRKNDQYQNQQAGIYFHIPFCVKKCPYCDFYSTTNLALQKAFLKALMREMRMLCDFSFLFDTIYIGGGTPSVLLAEDIGKIIETIRQVFKISADVEITMEVNPGAVDQERFAGYKSAGVNRINIGAQSFQETNLAFLGRIHSEKDINPAVKWARKAGFDNMGLDLIYGIPGQTRQSWLLDLQKAVDLKPEHLSCYMLTYEPGTPMDKDRQEAGFCPLSDNLVGDMFELTVEFLSANNYVQYEISNFALIKSDKRADKRVNMSRHNRKYWLSAPYIGFGPAAHSFVEPVRYWNTRSVTKYIKDVNGGRLSIEGKEVLSREQQMIEAISLGLRMTDGIKTDVFDKKFDVSFKKIFATTIAYLEEDGLISVAENRCSLTRKGMLFADSITSMLI
ncbi:MAG: radical SAM family heme chaperone HemW [Desulfobacterales bacterium]|uniref:Heme chaperone HemW n=1 Tax=Candidatus Desulfaltia bathyphila TaxID=2841697 RepID=A0A8J6N487_9BACT|nr:radical SAM family heme chaperone HemW [Candidatus Desulfaltia bathyphila]MBL7207079.1 radical SAM family heme chaperone HemW [Desulfobacterales bacterium]